MESKKKNKGRLHCVKSVRIRRFSGPYFTAFGLNTERCISSYATRMRENKDQENSECYFSQSKSCEIAQKLNIKKLFLEAKFSHCQCHNPDSNVNHTGYNHKTKWLINYTHRNAINIFILSL